MPKDTSLSEFAGTTDEPDEPDERIADEPDERFVDESREGEQVDDEPVTEERAEGEPVETDETDGTDEDVSELDSDDVEPARATYDWTPDGADCACCGSSVEKRWRDGDGMVCADCKEW
ncbi:DUF7573 domain-containing protein [Haladaptatus sp.]|uniref:DUF7573 domain-containing protein n=1 Tax=Haladaptatus sp. TaxID=1973141 RepID=UPI003C42215F